jgi:O-antigen/teichoic acid export membrane protein
VQNSILTKIINFKLQTIAYIISQVTSGIVGIIMAVYGYGVWSLIWKTLLNQIILNVLYWVFVKWKPLFVFSWKSLKEMFSYSSKLLVSGIINKIYEQLYYLIIGKYYNPRELGLYTRADQFVKLPSESISGAIMSVSFPIFSQLQDEPERLKSFALKIIKMTMYVNICSMIGLFVISENLVSGILGSKWNDSVIYIQLLCISGLIYPLHPINLNLITALGRSGLFLKLEVIKKLFAVPVITLGIFLGVKAMIIAMIVSSFVSLYINSFYSKKLANLGLKEQLTSISNSFIIGIIMGLGVFVFGLLLEGKISNILLLSIQIITGIFIVVLLSRLFNIKEFIELQSLVRQYVRK